MLETNTLAGTIYVPGTKVHKILALLEDTLPAIVSDELPSSIVES